MLRALRGATTVDDDVEEHVHERVVELLEQMLRAQRHRPRRRRQHPLHRHRRLHSTFPALGARKAGFGDVPLICARELDVVRGTPAVPPGDGAPLHRAQPRRAPPHLPRTARSASATTSPSRPRWRARRAGLVGTGLIGGSIGLALRRAGLARHRRTTRDERPRATALELGAIDAVGIDPDAEVTFVATPGAGGRRRPPARRWPPVRASSPTSAA